MLPLLFRGRSSSASKTAINESVNARVDWRDLGLSLFRNFPNLTLTLDDLTAVGVDKFQGDTLAAVRHLRVVLDLASVLGNVMGGRPIVVRAVELDQPRLSLLALEDGTANWDITKKTPEPRSPRRPRKPVAISLRRFEITDAAVAFDNRQAKLKALVDGYDQSLSGDFSQDLVAIKTRADADTRERHLRRHPLSQPGQARPHRRRAGRPGEEVLHPQGDRAPAQRSHARRLRLGERPPARTLGLDLAFSAPSTNFRSILSLVPAVYAHDFDKVKTSGTHRGQRPGQGRVRRQRLPVARAQRQGGQRRLPVSRSPAPGARHRHGPRDHQPRRQRRQHGREAAEVPRAASAAIRSTRR